MASLRYLLLLLITSCGPFKALDSINSESHEFNSYIDTYIEMKYRHTGIDSAQHLIVIRFATLPYPVLGHCIRPQNDSMRTIEIDTTSWHSMSTERREALIFHELGHCDLDKGHNDFKPDLMNTHLIGGAYYLKRRATLLLQFFNNL